MTTQTLIVDYKNPQQVEDMLHLMDEYTQHPMIHSARLPAEIREKLADSLDKVPGAFTVLCYVDGQPAAFSHCLQSFSTFKCKPIINVHDVMVSADFRGHSLTRKLFDKIETVARERGCCKLTLEVLEKNEPARRAYKAIGFESYELDPVLGIAQFWEKPLEAGSR